MKRVQMAAPEMLELNCGYTGDFQIHFEERMVMAKAAV